MALSKWCVWSQFFTWALLLGESRFIHISTNDPVLFFLLALGRDDIQTKAVSETAGWAQFCRWPAPEPQLGWR